MKDGDFLALFYRFARHMPGLGGLDTFQDLELQEVLDIAKWLKRDMEREAAAWKGKR